MSGPLEGTKVVELGFWVAGPATAGILSDWGASVVKIEPPRGDPFRGIFMSAVGIDVPFNPPFELDNRGKRSVVLDLKHEEARAIARELIADADVFVSNLRPGALEKLGLDYETLSRDHPELVYCSVTGYGVTGPDRDRPAYDIGAFWSRGGVAAMLTPDGHEPPVQRGGMGDHTTAITAASAKPGGNTMGTSLSECTARSACPCSMATSSSLTNSPLPPILARDLSRIWSPCVVMPKIRTSHSGYRLRSRSRTCSACQSARRLSREAMTSDWGGVKVVEVMRGF